MTLLILIHLTSLTMSTNFCSADDTDLSCVFLPGGPSDLIPGTGCHPTHKTDCHGSPRSNLKYWHSDCRQAQTTSGDRLFKIACLLCLSPLPFVCCIWNEVLLCWEEREDLFYLGYLFCDGFVLTDQSQYKHSFQSKGIHMCAVFILQWKTSATFSILSFLH